MFFQNDPTAVTRRFSNSEVLARNGVISGRANGCYKLGVDSSTGDLYYRDVNNIWQPVPGGGGGGNQRFGVSGEDAIAGQARAFDLNGNELQIIGGNIGFGGNPSVFFNVLDGGNDLIAIDKVNFQSLFGANDGNSFASFVLNSDLVGNNVQFAITATDNVSLVQITGDAINQTINLGADAGVQINSSYTLPLADGTANYVLTTDGAGVTSWQPGGGGGPDTNFATDDLTFTGNRSHDLNENNLSILNGILPFLTISPTTGSESALFQAFNNTDDGNAARFVGNTTNISAGFVVKADFNNSTSVAGIVGHADATTNGMTYLAQLHEFTGGLILDDYTGAGIHVGTPVKLLAVDTGGNVIETALIGGGGVTASNGLAIDVVVNPGDVILGGDLNQTTNIDNHGFILDFTGTGIATISAHNTNNGTALNASATGTGIAVGGNAVDGKAIQGVSSGSGQGLYGGSNTGTGIFGTSTSGFALITNSITGIAGSFSVNPASTNTLVTIADFRRLTSGTAANNIAGSIDILLPTNLSTNTNAAKLISRVTDVTNATFTTEFSIQGSNNASMQTLFTLAGNGATKLNKYGLGNFTGTPAYTLQVDSGGNIIEGSGGGGNTIYTADDVLVSDREVGLNGHDLIFSDAGSFLDINIPTKHIASFVTDGTASAAWEINGALAGDNFFYLNSSNGVNAVSLMGNAGGTGMTLNTIDGINGLASIILNGDSVGSNINFQFTAQDFGGGNVVQLLGNAISNALTFVANVQNFTTNASGFAKITGLADPANNFVNDAAAAVGGVGINQTYHTAGVVKIRLV